MQEAHAEPSTWLAAAADHHASLSELRRAAAGCRACELWKRGTQTVFGAGPSDALLVIVGEQPGDREDLRGQPFVGPAGALLDRALAEAGLDPTRVYLTNAVKHFKWIARGKRRIHQHPSRNEVRACRPWLHAEIAAIAPRVVLCLGATAAQSLLGADFRVSVARGAAVASPLAPFVTATVHPASIVRAPDADRRRAVRRFVADLKRVAEWLGEDARREQQVESDRAKPPSAGAKA